MPRVLVFCDDLAELVEFAAGDDPACVGVAFCVTNGDLERLGVGTARIGLVAGQCVRERFRVESVDLLGSLGKLGCVLPRLTGRRPCVRVQVPR